MNICDYVLCRMGHPLDSSIIKLFFLSIAVQSNYTCPTTQNEENNLRHRPRKKEIPGKVLEKSEAAVIKIFQ